MCPRGGGVGHMAPICARAHATQRAAAPRAHPPPWASSPGQFLSSPSSPGDGSDEATPGWFGDGFIAVIFPDGRAPHQESTPHPPRNFSFSVLKLTDCDNQRGLNQAPSPNCPTSGAELNCRTRKNPQNQIRFPMNIHFSPTSISQSLCVVESWFPYYE